MNIYELSAGNTLDDSTILEIDSLLGEPTGIMLRLNGFHSKRLKDYERIIQVKKRTEAANKKKKTTSVEEDIDSDEASAVELFAMVISEWWFEGVDDKGDPTKTAGTLDFGKEGHLPYSKEQAIKLLTACPYFISQISGVLGKNENFTKNSKKS